MILYIWWSLAINKHATIASYNILNPRRSLAQMSQHMYTVYFYMNGNCMTRFILGRCNTNVHLGTVNPWKTKAQTPPTSNLVNQIFIEVTYRLVCWVTYRNRNSSKTDVSPFPPRMGDTSQKLETCSTLHSFHAAQQVRGSPPLQSLLLVWGEGLALW